MSSSAINEPMEQSDLDTEDIALQSIVDRVLEKFKATWSDTNGLLSTINSESCHYTNIAIKLIESVRKQRHFGGSSYSSSLMKAREQFELTLDCLWEKLNIGSWKDVGTSTRLAFAITSAAFVKTCLLLVSRISNYLFTALEVLDRALLMGVDRLEDFLASTAHEIHSCICKYVPESLEEANAMNRNSVKYHKLAIPDILPNQYFRCSLEIKTLSKPSVQIFKTYYDSNCPVILLNSINDWQALKKWNVNYFMKMAQFRTVPVEVGSKYTSPDWHQRLMTVGDFIKEYIVREDPGAKGYIAQYCLTKQVSCLQDDIRVPDYCFVGDQNTAIVINNWFGPEGTVSPLHYDPRHNLLAQVFGTKRIRLYSPECSEELRPFQNDSVLSNTSRLDLEYDDFTLVAKELTNCQYYEFDLSAGEMLYIPPKWWHFVKSKSVSMSISFWFD